MKRALEGLKSFAKIPPSHPVVLLGGASANDTVDEGDSRDIDTERPKNPHPHDVRMAPLAQSSPIQPACKKKIN